MPIAVLLFLLIPARKAPQPDRRAKPGSAPRCAAMGAVFLNPQSILCGLIAGLLFIPTTIFDMVWGVRFLQEAHDMPYSVAVLRSASVPFGWIIGCPLLGWLTDRIGRRKPVIIGAGAGPARLPRARSSTARRACSRPTRLGLARRHRLGRGDDPLHGDQGSQPARAQRHRDRRHQLPQLLADRAARPGLRGRLMAASAGGERELAHYQATFPPLLYGVALAIVLTLLLRETGPKRARSRAPRPAPSSRPTEPPNGDIPCPRPCSNPKPRRRPRSRPAIQARPVDEGNQRPRLHPAELHALLWRRAASSPGRPSGRTAIWKKLTDLFVEERKKGVLDVSQIPSSITAHDAGYIDKDNEIIVGLQTDAPLKRAIMPNGGLKMVTERARDLRLQARPDGRRDLHQVPQDPQRRRCSTPIPRTSAAAAARTS